MTTFEYISVLLSIIVGLGMVQLLTGIGRMIADDQHVKPYWVHLVWVSWLFLLHVFFWWFQFQLNAITNWYFFHYLVIILYAVLLYLFAVVLMPRRGVEGGDFRAYFYRRKVWFGGFVLVMWGIDIIDTLLKGWEHFVGLQPAYTLIWGALAIAAAMTMRSDSPRVQAVIAVAIIGWQVFWVWSYFGEVQAAPVTGTG